ncbi:MAG: hypothetical protein J6S85_08655 [Methanobrevibacter sp.]|nr:hypothetical protein [Methanobrevibacter sp.]
MKISNKAKDYIVLIVIFFAIVWLLSGLIFWVKNAFAEPISNEELNKAENEQIIYQEIRYLQMWEYTEGMSQEEWEKTFLRG